LLYRTIKILLYAGAAEPEDFYLPFGPQTTMTASLSKRHQARNERNLQELIKTIPGNDRCADCQARNPGKFRKHSVVRISPQLTHLFRLGKLECEHDRGKNSEEATDSGDESSSESSCACDAPHYIGSLALTYPK
jgi:hypothetical protein